MKVVAAFAVALLAFGLWTVPAWAQAEPPAPDLSITKAGPARVEPGEEFVYTLVVSNTGNAPATLVEVTDRLPEGVTFRESDPNICTSAPDPVNQARERVTCEILTLAAGASRTIELTVTAPSDAGVIENRATVGNADTEPENSNTVTTTVAPDLVIRKLDDPDPVTTEDLLLYTLRVTNRGSTDADNVVVVDDLPLDDVDLVRFQSDDFECERNAAAQTGLIRCTTDSLAAGATGTVEIVVEPEREGTIKNTAEVRAGGVRVDRDTEETTVKADAEETTAEETTNEENTDEETTGKQTTDQKTTGEQTTVIDGQTILIPDKLADTTLPDTGGPSGIALAAGCALLGVGLIVNRIFR